MEELHEDELLSKALVGSGPPDLGRAGLYLLVFTGITMYLPGQGGAALPPLHVLPVDL